MMKKRALMISVGALALSMVLAPTVHSADVEDAEAPTSDVVLTDVAIPPPEVTDESIVTADLASAPQLPAKSVNGHVNGHADGTSEDEPRDIAALARPVAFMNGTPAVNRMHDELPTLEFPSWEDEPRAMEFDPQMVHGEWVQSADTYQGSRRLHVQYDFHTVISWENGERPIPGEILCGSCPNPEDLSQLTALQVEVIDDLVTLKPRVFSSPERGVVGSNISVRTIDPQGRKHLYQFTAIEITGLLDQVGSPLRRTDYHIVKGAGTSSSTIVPAAFEARVAQATESIEAKLEEQLESAERSLLADKAHEGVEIYSEFDIVKKHGRRKLEIESAMTIGDETVIKAVLRRARGVMGAPVVFLETGSRLTHVDLRNHHVTPGEYKGKPAVYITATTDGVVLRDEQRLVLSVVDNEEREEFRAAAGRD